MDLAHLNSPVSAGCVLRVSGETNNRNDTADWQRENHVQRRRAQLRTFVERIFNENPRTNGAELTPHTLVPISPLVESQAGRFGIT